MVAMPGEGVHILLWHDLTGGVFDEDALDCTTPKSRGDGAVTLLHKITKHRNEERGGTDV